MINYIVCAIIIFFVYLLYNIIYSNNEPFQETKNSVREIKNPAIHPNKNYPCMKYIFDNKNIIIDEFMKNILNSDKWSNWMEYDKVSNTPIFTQMTYDNIISRMKENNCSLNIGINNDFLNIGTNKTKPSWKLYGLKLFGKPLADNIVDCPKTMQILSQCPNIINAGFSCLEPGVQTTLHHDFNHDILRCHIPIIIPKTNMTTQKRGTTAIMINNEIVYWDINKYFIFDDTYDHQAWNFTNELRIVLILDILKQ